MTWIGKGKVTVGSAGTPVVLSASQLKVNTIMFTYDPADSTTTVYVKDASGNVLAPMSPSGSTQPLQFVSPSGNQLDLSKFYVDSALSGKGPYVAYAIE